MEYVTLKNINKTYGSYQASTDVNFSIEKGKLVALLGPSGSGKTTILRMIAGLEKQDSGDIIINGQVVNDLPGSKRGIGFVFQNYALFRYMTVAENIATGLKIQKMPKKQIQERVEELLELVGLKGLGDRYPNQLSGGQRQRVAFARAIAPNPQLLLLDEPFAAIDVKVRQELRSWLREMITNLGITSIFVTHDQDEAIEVSDEIILTNRGRIEQIGTPADIYANPQTAFTAQFFGKNAVLKDYEGLRSFEEVPDFDQVLIRPEFVRIYKENEQQQFSATSSPGKVLDVVFRGDSSEITVQVGDKIIVGSRSMGETPVNVGENVYVLVYRLILTREEQVKILDNYVLLGDDVFM
ncbi:MAG: ABC transporter ATP-binding protein [Lachnospiraceae bacterium]|nr:ABC transporter ATP-binding protein [Lachnospiraceae bacterium]